MQTSFEDPSPVDLVEQLFAIKPAAVQVEA
jgi:hypothetical protein